MITGVGLGSRLFGGSSRLAAGGSRLAAGGSRLVAGGSRLVLAVAGCWSRGAKKNTQITKDSTIIKSYA